MSDAPTDLGPGKVLNGETGRLDVEFGSQVDSLRTFRLLFIPPGHFIVLLLVYLSTNSSIFILRTNMFCLKTPAFDSQIMPSISVQTYASAGAVPASDHSVSDPPSPRPFPPNPPPSPA